MERSPTRCLDGVFHWRLYNLAQWLWQEFRVSVSKQKTLSREIKAIGYRKLAAHPKHHAQDHQVLEDIKKSLPPLGRNRRRSGRRE
jgi:hypothetical protein